MFGVSSVLLTYPLLIAGLSIFASIIGSLFIRLKAGDKRIMRALYKGLVASVILAAVAFAFATWKRVGLYTISESGEQLYAIQLFSSLLIGLIITALIVWITDYYTSTKHKPVKRLAAASETGHGTNVIAGLALGLRSTVWPVIIIVLGILITYSMAGLYGVAAV